MGNALLIYDNPEKNADIYYAAGFRAPDAFIFFEKDGKKYMVMSDLEIDRAKREAKVDSVISVKKYNEKAAKKNGSYGIADVIYEVLADHDVNSVKVPENMSFVVVDFLRQKGIDVVSGGSPFYPERFVKSPAERKIILDAQKVVFGAMKLARDVIAASKIKNNRLIYKGRALSSDSLRTMINIFLLEKSFVVADTIVACGKHAIDPHDLGSGPLYPNQSIIVDIYPRSMKTLYCGDATRTFCRGRASDALKKMYVTVKEAQEMGIKMVKADIPGKSVHEAIHAFFKSKGYVTGEKGGRQQGFFHGTGHSIGLEVHEDPARINFGNYMLKAGNVMSVEPGLYYPEIGGVRIEDLIFVTKTGCDVLSGFPKKLEI